MKGCSKNGQLIVFFIYHLINKGFLFKVNKTLSEIIDFNKTDDSVEFDFYKNGVKIHTINTIFEDGEYIIRIKIGKKPFECSFYVQNHIDEHGVLYNLEPVVHDIDEKLIEIFEYLKVKGKTLRGQQQSSLARSGLKSTNSNIVEQQKPPKKRARTYTYSCFSTPQDQYNSHQSTTYCSHMENLHSPSLIPLWGKQPTHYSNSNSRNSSVSQTITQNDNNSLYYPSTNNPNNSNHQQQTFNNRQQSFPPLSTMPDQYDQSITYYSPMDNLNLAPLIPSSGNKSTGNSNSNSHNSSVLRPITENDNNSFYYPSTNNRNNLNRQQQPLNNRQQSFPTLSTITYSQQQQQLQIRNDENIFYDNPQYTYNYDDDYSSINTSNNGGIGGGSNSNNSNSLDFGFFFGYDNANATDKDNSYPRNPY